MVRRIEAKKANKPPTAILIDTWEIKGFLPERAKEDKQELSIMAFIEGHNKRGGTEKVRLAFYSNQLVDFIIDSALIFNKVMEDVRDQLISSGSTRFTSEELDLAVKNTETLIEIADGMHRLLERYNDAKSQAS